MSMPDHIGIAFGTTLEEGICVVCDKPIEEALKEDVVVYDKYCGEAHRLCRDMLYHVIEKIKAHK